jgi:hypothetical protein
MATAYSTNFPIPAQNNVFQVIWKLTRVMKSAGWNVKAYSDGSSTYNATGSNETDIWGNNSNPLLDTYPNFDTYYSWIVMSGPKTLKLFLGVNPATPLLRGETITQPSSSFEGELLGYVWDATSNTGHAVIAPRVGTLNPTGGTITGLTSGGILSPASIGTPLITYTREVMFAKDSGTVNGQVYYVCADQAAESATLFSSLATSAGVSVTNPPGTGGTGNAFPANAIAIRGTGGANTYSTWFGATNNYGNYAQMACVNATPGTGLTADGSFYTVLSTVSSGNMSGFMFSRLDDTEPGDVDPYIWFFPQNHSFSLWSRTSNNSYPSSTYFYSYDNVITSTNICFIGYQARGASVTARDVAVGYTSALLSNGGSAGGIHNNQYPKAFRILNHPNATPPVWRENQVIYTPGTTPGTSPQVKGKIRWMTNTSVGLASQTTNGNKFICVVSWTGSTPAMLIGPYDGITTPLI